MAAEVKITEVVQMRDLRAQGFSIKQVAALVGRDQQTVVRYAPGFRAGYSNVPLREAFERSGLSATEVAVRLGWTWGGNGKGDSARVKRALGILDDFERKNGTTRRRRRRRVGMDLGEQLADVLGVERWELEDAA